MEAGPQCGHLWLRASPPSPSRGPASVAPPKQVWLPGLLHLTPTPPEAAWVTRHQARRLRDARGGRGAERGPLWSGTGVLAGTGEGLAGARSAKAVSRTVSVPPQLVTRGQKQVSGCSSAEPPGSLLASGETCWFQAILELVGTHIPLKALS